MFEDGSALLARPLPLLTSTFIFWAARPVSVRTVIGSGAGKTPVRTARPRRPAPTVEL